MEDALRDDDDVRVGLSREPDDAGLEAEALGDAARADQREHAAWAQRVLQNPFEVVTGVDPLDLSQAGWAVVFAPDTPPAVRKALEPLLAHRREQAGALYRELAGDEGYRPGDTKLSFLARRGIGPNPVDPRQLPYYVLLVGSGAQIPFAFQCQLDLQYAVGRLAFREASDYARYAQGVLDVEAGRAARPRRAAVFGPRNPGDDIGALAHDRLSLPLARALAGERGWSVEASLGADATRARLLELLGARAPALLVTAGHGVAIDPGDTRQHAYQGALVCQDWDKTRYEHPSLSEAVAGRHLDRDADLRGLIVFSLACFSAGTPRHNGFVSLDPERRRELAEHDFVAALPQRLLSHEAGPALAMIGHVDAAFEHSFAWLPEGDQGQAFVSAARLLLHGAPVGRAMECFGQRYAELSAELGELQESKKLGFRPDPATLQRVWLGTRDARGYVLLGDPAVRLGAQPEREASRAGAAA